MALGLLATTERSDEIEIALPAQLAVPLSRAMKELCAAGDERGALAPETGTPSVLRGPRAALRELLAVAIEDAADEAARAGQRFLRGEDAQAAELRACHSRLGALLDLLEPILRG